MIPQAVKARFARATSSQLSSAGCVLLFIAVMPGLKSSWHYANGGVAAREWSLGVPGSPLITLQQVGSGPFDSIHWSFPAPELHLVSISLPFLIGYFLVERVARRRKREGHGRVFTTTRG